MSNAISGSIPLIVAKPLLESLIDTPGGPALNFGLNYASSTLASMLRHRRGALFYFMLEGEKLEEAHARYVALNNRIEAGRPGKTLDKCIELIAKVPHYVKRFKPSHGLPSVLYQNGSIRELPLDDLYAKYAEHKRLKIFAKKGLKCAWPGCTHIGSRLIVTIDLGGSLHPDIYTHDLTLMTVDHIVPKALGGGEELTNKQPMCFAHNFAKGVEPMPE